MSGGGLASDGNWIYFTTGNNKDNFNRINGLTPYPQPVPPVWGTGDYSNSILQWGPSFFEGAYVPDNSYRGQLDKYDADLGSSRVIVVPNTNYIVAGSKYGDFYILNRNVPMSSSSLVRQITQLCVGGEALYSGLHFGTTPFTRGAVAMS